jgi:hypothetical protein
MGCRLGLLVALGGTCLLVAPAWMEAQANRERPVGELRDCRSRGEGTKPQQLPPTPGTRIGPLLFWPSIRTPDRGPARASEWPFVFKAPVVLPAGAKLVLAIAPEAVGQAAFQHRGFVSAVRFQACYERVRAWTYRGTVGKYTGFPFAVGLKKRAACVPMEVWIDGQQQPIRRVVPVGRRSC